MEAETTPWFDGSVKPVHVGPYERDDTGTTMEDGEPNFSYWNGTYWGVSRNNVHATVGVKLNASEEQCLPWRGLAKKPEAA